MGKVIMGGIGLLILFGMIFGSASDDDDEGGRGGRDEPDQSEVIGDEIGAQVVCEDFVKDRLKSPSTADFSNAEVRHLNGKVWLVTGDVDSENTFGAMIRNTYACKARFVGDDRWQLVNMGGLRN